MKSVGLDRWIETRVIAGHEISPKPDAEPFAMALDTLDVAPERAVKVGDSLETDIAGANALGIESVWVSDESDSEDVEPTHRIERLDELLTLPLLSSSSSST
jgi:putative hydrolase of the HAD superfamily